MVDVRYPGVFTQEIKAPPRIAGVATTLPAFLVYTKRGPVNDLGFVSNWSDFVRQYGSYYRGSLGPLSMKAYFDTVLGGSAYIVRVIGAGSAIAEQDFNNMGAEGEAAEALSTVDLTTLTLDLSNRKYLKIEVDGAPAGGVDVDLTTAGTSLDTARTLTDIIASINAVFAGLASDSNGFLRLLSPTVGATSNISLYPVTGQDFAATFLGVGFNAATLNQGNYNIILNLDAQGPITIDVTGDLGVGGGYSLVSVLAAINAAASSAWGAAYNSIASDVGGQIQLQSPLTGAASSVEIGDGPAGTGARLEIFGLSEGSGPVSVTGGTGDAINLVMGLTEGSTYSYDGQDTVSPLFKVKAANPGAWGNDISVTTQRYETVLVSPLPSNQDFAIVGSLRDITVGDIVKISDGITSIIVHINGIDIAQNRIDFTGQGTAHATINTTNSKVNSSTTHRKVTTSVAAITATDTTVELDSTKGINVGTRVVFDDKGVNPVTTAVVTSINGNFISFAALGQAVATDAVVSTIHFDLSVFDNGNLLSTFKFLSIESTDAKDFFGKRLSGDSNESIDIELEELTYNLTNFLLSAPEPVVSVKLLGGVDGAAPTDLDWVGSDLNPKSGMYLIEDEPQISVFAAPGVTYTTTLRRFANFAEQINTIMAVADVPLEYDQALEARQFRLLELALDSSYMALYYPWGKTRDPESDNEEALLDIPLSPYVVAAYIATARDENVSVAPANFRLLVLDNLTHFTNNGEQSILNEIGVNVVRFFQGSGITIWGARTLNNEEDGTHYVPVRRLLNFIKASAQVGNRFAVFRPNDPALWNTLKDVNRDFLASLWRQGMLYPSDNIDLALFVKCDEETNPESERKAGRVNIELGVQPQYPAEFVIVKVGQLAGTNGSVEEIIRRI